MPKSKAGCDDDFSPYTKDSTAGARRRSINACAGWLRSSELLEKPNQHLTDSKGRGADEWKQHRRESCRWMFLSALMGIGTAMWADYILFIDHQEPSARCKV